MELRVNKKIDELKSEIVGLSHSVQKLTDLKDSVEKLYQDSQHAATKDDLDALDMKMNSFALKTVFQQFSEKTDADIQRLTTQSENIEVLSQSLQTTVEQSNKFLGKAEHEIGLLKKNAKSSV